MKLTKLALLLSLGLGGQSAWGDLTDSLEDLPANSEAKPEKPSPSSANKAGPEKPEPKAPARSEMPTPLNASESETANPAAAAKGKILGEASLSPAAADNKAAAAPSANKQTETSIGEGEEKTGKKGASKGEQRAEGKRQPVYFEGEELSGYRQQGLIELHAQVRVRQDGLFLEADHAKVFFDQDSDEVSKVIAEGRVQLTRKDPVSGERVKANSQLVEFDVRQQTLVLTGNAKLSRGEDIIRGEVIHYDLKTGWLQGSKVKGVVKPENQVKSSKGKDH